MRKPALTTPAGVSAQLLVTDNQVRRTAELERPAEPGSERPIDHLVTQVLDIADTPVDAYGVAATLESQGMRDLDAQQQFGKRDVFELAQEVFTLAREQRPGAPTWAAPALDLRLRPRVLARTYLRGAFSFLPLLLQMLALVTIGFSQWAWIHFSVAQASVVALGIGLSMLATAPFIQVLGYLGPMFAMDGKHTLTRAVTYRLLVLGLLGSAVLGGVIAAALLASGAYTARRLEIALVYDLLTSLLWLSNAALYMLGRQIAMAASFTLSLAVVGAVLNFTGLGIYAAHWLGLATAIAVELGCVVAVLHRRAGRTRPTLRKAPLPRYVVLARWAAPLATYRLGYFALLLADRVVAWSYGHNPAPIWFNVRYELGLDLALLAATAGLAFLECTMYAITRQALPQQDRFSAHERPAHNRWFVRFYGRQLLIVVLLIGIGAVAAAGIVTALHELHALGVLDRYYSDPVTRRAFLLGVIGFLGLAVGAANTGVLFVFGRPGFAARAVMIGVAVDLLVGLFLSRSVGFSYAVAGMAAGAGAFALASGYSAARVLRGADYYLYTAY